MLFGSSRTAMVQTNNKRKKANVVDKAEFKFLIEQLWSLRKSMQEQESVMEPWLVGVDPSYSASARNFAHYLALRHVDRRPLQESLDQIGVSALGRAESDVLANLDKVLGILLQLAGEPWRSHCKDEPASIQTPSEQGKAPMPCCVGAILFFDIISSI
jgi:pyruvate kinase